MSISNDPCHVNASPWLTRIHQVITPGSLLMTHSKLPKWKEQNAVTLVIGLFGLKITDNYSFLMGKKERKKNVLELTGTGSFFFLHLLKEYNEIWKGPKSLHIRDDGANISTIFPIPKEKNIEELLDFSPVLSRRSEFIIWMTHVWTKFRQVWVLPAQVDASWRIAWNPFIMTYEGYTFPVLLGLYFYTW